MPYKFEEEEATRVVGAQLCQVLYSNRHVTFVNRRVSRLTWNAAHAKNRSIAQFWFIERYKSNRLVIYSQIDSSKGAWKLVDKLNIILSEKKLLEW